MRCRSSQHLLDSCEVARGTKILATTTAGHVGDRELVACARQRHVANPSFLEILRWSLCPGAWQHAFLHPGHKDRVELQTLGLVYRHDLDPTTVLWVIINGGLVEQRGLV